ncbi:MULTISPECIES: hypothetical protein [Burkholderia]|uniref:hypothetical protein n=1 Tax=Burkholderia TaxID=32008 RepID=UPI001AE10344|nr:hypothetical protein [Burkholderia sp. AcTa6-5]
MLALRSTMLPATLARPVLGASLQQRRHQFLDVLPRQPARKAAGERRRSVHGRSSARAVSAMQATFVACDPNARLVTIPNGGH